VYAAAANPGSCDMVCTKTQCDTMGLGTSDIACIAGRCVFSRSCDLRSVACEMAEPECPAGQVPSAQGNCYGPCIPVGRCGDVSSCSVCTTAGLSCVTLDGMVGPSYHCVITPVACSTEPDCDCMGVCKGGYVCSGASRQELTCSCPTC
jgi:hypothetical protein